LATYSGPSIPWLILKVRPFGCASGRESCGLPHRVTFGPLSDGVRRPAPSATGRSGFAATAGFRESDSRIAWAIGAFYHRHSHHWDRGRAPESSREPHAWNRGHRETGSGRADRLGSKRPCRATILLATTTEGVPGRRFLCQNQPRAGDRGFGPGTAANDD